MHSINNGASQRVAANDRPKFKTDLVKPILGHITDSRGNEADPRKMSTKNKMKEKERERGREREREKEKKTVETREYNGT